MDMQAWVTVCAYIGYPWAQEFYLTCGPVVIKTVLTLLSLLPLWLLRALGALIGQISWWSQSRGARTAQVNLALCFPELGQPERRRLAARSMRHWGMSLCEIPHIWRLGRASLEYIVDVEGKAEIDAALAAGKGCIIVSPHLGNWELVGYWAGTLGPITTLYQPPRRFDVDDYLRHVRSKTGATLVPTTSRGVAQLIKALKRGELIGVLPDMEPELSSGAFAPFFGVPALTMTLLHSLVRRTDSPVFVGFAQRIRGGFKIIFYRPDEAIAAESAGDSVAALNRVVERLVALAPEQYQWEYKRFKRRPVDEKSVY